MSFLGWMSLCGGLLLLMALSSAYLRRLPVSTSAMCLGVGLAVGPLGLGWLRVDICDATPWFEHLPRWR
jgi:NhaP-type Na+/H+ or K+/H+ antiporter